MDAATQEILGQGLLGAIVVLLIGVVIFMQRKLDKKEAELTAIQDKWRISETERAEKLTEALNTASAVQSALVEKIRTGRGEL